MDLQKLVKTDVIDGLSVEDLENSLDDNNQDKFMSFGEVVEAQSAMQSEKLEQTFYDIQGAQTGLIQQYQVHMQSK